MNISPEGLGSVVAPSEDYETGQIVILWKDNNEAKKGLALLEREYKLQPANLINLPNLGSGVAIFQLGSNPQAAALRNRLRKDFPEWVVDFNVRYRGLDGPRLYANERIGVTAHKSPNIKNIRIGMLDGVINKIAALSSVKLIERNFLTNNDTPAAQAHATGIAALLAGKEEAKKFSGIAPGVNLFAGVIMRKQGNGEGTTTTYLLQGLEWLLQEKVHIINLSLGGAGDALMKHAFSVIAKKPVIVVAAAGNSGPDASPSYPAAYRGVLAVTAVDAMDQIYQNANQGSYIQIAAPGVDLWVPDQRGGSYTSGTSYAAAIVSGSIILLLAQMPVANPQSIIDLLCKNAKDLGMPGKDPVFGCGLLQIGAAYKNRGGIKN